MAEKLRDLSQPIDVPVLDATVAAFFGTGSKEERNAAYQILQDLQNNQDMWLQVVHILQNSQNLNTKFFALQVLESVIKYRWNALPSEQRDRVKNYISDVIFQLSSNEVSFRKERLYVNKLNIILVQFLKHKWPASWASFISDLVAAAKSSETICENCMAILKLVSEEFFDLSRTEMTSHMIEELKSSLNSEFRLIHELCLYVLCTPQSSELIRGTLATLRAFLPWIPVGFIFDSPLLETLLKFFPMAAYRHLTLQCLTEVAALQFGDFYNMQYVNMYTIFMMRLQGILPPRLIPNAYANGSNDEQAFMQNLALFFTSFFKSHIHILERYPENRDSLLLGLEYLIGISFIDNTEVFKVCLYYWNAFVSELLQERKKIEPATAAAEMIPRAVDGTSTAVEHRQQLYSGSLSKLRALMICRMAKPEEVLIVEDENGNIVRETLKDNDVLVQYKIMKEILIYLTLLDHEDTEQQMLKKLTKQLNGEDWSWNNLNSLCWAIGSISGSMVEEQENRFLVMVICGLLDLCEITKGKDNKAVIASNIMYVVGQYPRFLWAHWKFLKIVVKKVFEFMHEMHPGVQDMAFNTFLKIVQKCKRKFVTQQVGENEPLVSELLFSFTTTFLDLEPHQIHTFYESAGHMIQAELDNTKRDEYLKRLMGPTNQKWAKIIGQAGQSIDILKNQDVIRSVLNILQTNTSVAAALGPHFLPQISSIFLDMLTVYRMYSELVSSTIAEGGPYASKSSFVKLLRSVKGETLKLIETFLDKAEDLPHLRKQFVPPMMDPVLGDYARNVSDARESEVLSLFATIINNYKAEMLYDVPRIFDAVFECTLKMITGNIEDCPEHAVNFFSLLRAIGTHCFKALIQLSSQQLKLLIDSISWAIRRTERNIAETGLSLLLEILKNFQTSAFQNQFYKTYFLSLEQEIFSVMIDSFHKPGFKLHVLVLQHLFCVVDDLKEPLWDVSTIEYKSNAVFVREYTTNLVGTSFPNMMAAKVSMFVDGLLSSRHDLTTFESQTKDFLVQSKEFLAQDNKDIYTDYAHEQIGAYLRGLSGPVAKEIEGYLKELLDPDMLIRRHGMNKTTAPMNGLFIICMELLDKAFRNAQFAHKKIRLAIQRLQEATDGCMDPKGTIYSAKEISSYALSGPLREVENTLNSVREKFAEYVSLVAKKDCETKQFNEYMFEGEEIYGMLKCAISDARYTSFGIERCLTLERQEEECVYETNEQLQEHLEREEQQWLDDVAEHNKLFTAEGKERIISIIIYAREALVYLEKVAAALLRWSVNQKRLFQLVQQTEEKNIHDADLIGAEAFSTESGRSGYITVNNRSTPNGMYLESDPFENGGYKWRLRCYLNGMGDATVGFISCFLLIDPDQYLGDHNVEANFEFSFKENFTAVSILQGSKTAAETILCDAHEGSKFRTSSKYGNEKVVRLKFCPDCFTIQCNIDIDDSSCRTSSMATLLDIGYAADIEFHVSGEKFLAHQFILAAGSPVFFAALCGEMKESGGTYTVEEMDPLVFKMMLEYMYSGHVTGINGEETDTLKEILVAADRYDLPGLKLICEDILTREAHVDPNLWEFARTYNCNHLQHYLMKNEKVDLTIELSRRERFVQGSLCTTDSAKHVEFLSIEELATTRLQEEGKTDHASKDLDHLTLIWQQREEAAKNHEEEKAVKEEEG
ncbi:protein EXPORTIN 1A-like isoform X2 [Lolium rigidum]|uniref:protein EXPORTIN 1A-like isoform X2 n=1 Tax=Lolium rigidum TaxID=89674 RepID=UPI001F5D0FF9|nr:protein EXPORTIN 1A-like isoform X2 [Lolium rigidum]